MAGTLLSLFPGVQCGQELNCLWGGVLHLQRAQLFGVHHAACVPLGWLTSIGWALCCMRYAACASTLLSYYVLHLSYLY